MFPPEPLRLVLIIILNGVTSVARNSCLLGISLVSQDFARVALPILTSSLVLSRNTFSGVLESYTDSGWRSVKTVVHHTSASVPPGLVPRFPGNDTFPTRRVEAYRGIEPVDLVFGRGPSDSLNPKAFWELSGE